MSGFLEEHKTQADFSSPDLWVLGLPILDNLLSTCFSLAGPIQSMAPADTCHAGDLHPHLPVGSSPCLHIPLAVIQDISNFKGRKRQTWFPPCPANLFHSSFSFCAHVSQLFNHIPTYPAASLANLGVVLDSLLSFVLHVQPIILPCLQNASWVCPRVFMATTLDKTHSWPWLCSSLQHLSCSLPACSQSCEMLALDLFKASSSVSSFWNSS